MGIVLLLIACFGWARPVPVNRENFSRPRLMGVIVSAVGPISNLLLATLGALIYAVLLATGVLSPIPVSRLQEAGEIFFYTFISLNYFLFFFNLIPLPPLDGYRIFEDIAPRSIRGKLQQFEQWSIFIFLMILFIPVLRDNTITPLYTWAYLMYIDSVNFFYQLFV